MKTHDISKIGEKIVHNLLPNSKWLNENGENHFSYDIEWKGLKIDVKTTTVKVRWFRLGKLTREYFNFSVAGRFNEAKIMIFVAIDLDENNKYKYYFWIDKNYTNQARKNINEAIDGSELEKYLL